VVGFFRTPIFLVLLFGSCVRSQAIPCGALVCPEDDLCANGNRCVARSLVAACSGLAEGVTCTLSDLGNGTCQGGLCITGTCGNGKVDGNEACDGKDLGGKTCMDFGSTFAAGLACAADCSFDLSGCNGVCGDGKKGAAEECDGNDFGGKTCTDLSPPGTMNKFYRGGAPTCTVDCKINVGTCTGGYCGDGVIHFGEDCDGSDFGGATCASLLHPGATTPLVCDQTTCTFTDDSCSCGVNGPCAAGKNCVNNVCQ
jgi:hypothetical protein